MKETQRKRNYETFILAIGIIIAAVATFDIGNFESQKEVFTSNVNTEVSAETISMEERPAKCAEFDPAGSSM